MYNFLHDGGVKNIHLNLLWNIKTPLKVRIFVRIVLHRKVLKADNLAKSGLLAEESYILCREEPKTVDHLFVGCTFTRSLLEGMFPNNAVFLNAPSINRLWESCDQKGDTLKRWNLTIIAAPWWVIWLERNMRIYNKRLGLLISVICFVFENLSASDSASFFFFSFFFRLRFLLLRPGCLFSLLNSTIFWIKQQYTVFHLKKKKKEKSKFCTVSLLPYQFGGSDFHLDLEELLPLRSGKSKYFGQTMKQRTL